MKTFFFIMIVFSLKFAPLINSILNFSHFDILITSNSDDEFDDEESSEEEQENEEIEENA